MQSIFRTSVLTLAAVAALSLPSQAQQQPIRTITTYRILPGRAADFTSSLKSYHEVLKKAGWDKPTTVWLSLSGPREYVLVGSLSNYADLDRRMPQDPKLAEYRGQLSTINARMLACVESSSRVIEEVLPELSVRSTDIAPLARVHRVVVKPDHVVDYLALMKSELFPAVQKSGAKGFLTMRTRYGARSSEFRSVSGLEHWSDLDGPNPVRKAMGEEAYLSFVKKVTAMIVESDYEVYRFLPEASYLPPVPTTSTR